MREKSQSQEGNVVSVRQAHALFSRVAQQAPPGSRTRPSLGPETRARQSWEFPCRIFAIAIGQASRFLSRKWECRRGGTGTGGADLDGMRGSPRFAVSQENVRGSSEKEGGHGHRPCEESRAPCSVSVRRGHVAEVDRQSPDSKYARTQRSKKGGGESEREPSGARAGGARASTWSGRANGVLVSRPSRSNRRARGTGRDPGWREIAVQRFANLGIPRTSDIESRVAEPGL